MAQYPVDDAGNQDCGDDQYTNVHLALPVGWPVTGVNVMPVATGVANVRAAPDELLAVTSRVRLVPAGALCGVAVKASMVTTLTSPVATTVVFWVALAPAASVTVIEMLIDGMI
jgi:hypothetical protein